VGTFPNFPGDPSILGSHLYGWPGRLSSCRNAVRSPRTTVGPTYPTAGMLRSRCSWLDVVRVCQRRKDYSFLRPSLRRQSLSAGSSSRAVVCSTSIKQPCLILLSATGRRPMSAYNPGINHRRSNFLLPYRTDSSRFLPFSFSPHSFSPGLVLLQRSVCGILMAFAATCLMLLTSPDSRTEG